MLADLPELYTHPTSASLLATLDGLQQETSSFEGAYDQNAESFLDAREVRSYLTSIISSPLTWLPEDERDAVWDAASRRLSERAGRSARPAHDRTLTIPYSQGSISITLHEPTLTADRLGHKTWAAGYLLAKRIPLLSENVPPFETSSHSSPCLILELGSGTGLVGLALAFHIPSATLHLTDLEDIVPNLAANTERNFPWPSPRQSPPRIRVFPVDWRGIPPPEETGYTCARTRTVVTEARRGAYALVIAADVLYGDEHPPLVAQAAAYFLTQNERARVVIEVPRRERDVGLVESLQAEMHERGLSLIDHGEEEGWEEMGADEGRVRCWWGIWQWEKEKNS